MNVKELLKEKIDKASPIDFLISVAGVMLVCIASPYVMRQFANLKAPGDIFWNICWDILIFDVGLIVLIILNQAIKALSAWLKKKY